MGKMAAAVGSVATLAVEPGEDAFRKLFRFYRQSRPGTADLEGVIDFSVSHAARGTGPGALKVVKSQLNLCSVSDHDALRAGLQPVSKWQAHGLQGYPGYQWHWVKQCLKLYSRKPNVCNLDKHMTEEETQDLWEQSKEFLRCKEVNKRRPRSLLEKLRWVTLGYHYNWDSKRYSADHYTPFPSDLAFLSEQVAAACGFQGFQAEAGILNYYRLDSTLGIHVDRSELDHSRPLLSFSFGQSAIFLLGGLKRDEAPTPMFMHSGDIMVLAVGQDFPLEPMEENKRNITTEGSCHLDEDNSQVKRARLNPDC
ncbi:nucleic acid dioxygenase ALKBH1 isoform X4 [Ovis canadensis]|uniref:nucleic acid dioxygenase ALKBH1 isoform X4 n=1 Tax=Ovis canadensis TaxID=37174 RepID=UPI0038B6986D